MLPDFYGARERVLAGTFRVAMGKASRGTGKYKLSENARFSCQLILIDVSALTHAVVIIGSG